MEKQEKTIKMRKRKEVPYFQVENSIFDLKCPLKPNEFVVYLYLTRLTNSAQDAAYPSYNTIAKSCNISRRTAINTVENLKIMRLLEIEKRDKQSNLYYINQYTDVFQYICQFYGYVVQEMHHASAGDAPSLVQEMHHPGAGDAPPLVQEMHHPGAGDAPNKEILHKERVYKEREDDEEDKKKEKEIQKSLKNVEDCLTNILCFPKEWTSTVLQELQKHNLILTIKEVMLLTDVYERISEQIDKINKFDIYFVTCYLEELRKERSKEFSKKLQKICE